ncbi:MAG: dihydrodipicolinate reductase C-terminal domain-containing protein [Gemmatimonadota bacterium]
MRIALVGNGRMGQAIQALAASRDDELVTVISGEENRSGEMLTADRLDAAEVVLEFTHPTVAPMNLLRLAQLGMPVVSGTTGWSERLPEVEAAFTAGTGALLHSANFSVGVHLFLRAAAVVAAGFKGRPEYEEFILEAHHKHKLDAPSGTALRLQAAVRHADRDRDFPVSSIRAGAIAGMHRLSYDSAGESISLNHTARGREPFAAGALAAADWLRGRRGVHRFEAMLFGEEG